jgi:Plavaka transposase
VDIPPGTPPPPPPFQSPNDWTPYRNRVDFEMSEFLYKTVQMSAGSVDTLSQLIRATLLAHETSLDNIDVFTHNDDLLATIDSTLVGDVPWQGFSMSYEGPFPDEVPAWMTTTYDVWHRDPRQLLHNLLANREFNGDFDYVPFREFDAKKRRCWRDFMSGDWAWKEADLIAQNPETHGAMLVPIVLGSDKTTVSVATGQNEYYPLYMSIGNVRNNVRRAHGNAVVLLGLLAIPKSTSSKAHSTPG